jgi:hypothetical protein
MRRVARRLRVWESVGLLVVSLPIVLIAGVVSCGTNDQPATSESTRTDQVVFG